MGIDIDVCLVIGFEITEEEAARVSAKIASELGTDYDFFDDDEFPSAWEKHPGIQMTSFSPYYDCDEEDIVYYVHLKVPGETALLFNEVPGYLARECELRAFADYFGISFGAPEIAAVKNVH